MGVRLKQQLISNRHAEHGFKMFAALARLDIKVRILLASHTFLLDKKPDRLCNPASLLAISGQAEIVYDNLEYDNVWETNNPDSIINLIKVARTHANLVRDILSETIWQQVNQLLTWFSKKTAVNMFIYERSLFYQHLQSVYVTILGTYFHVSMRDKLYYFMGVGMIAERIQHTYRVMEKIINDSNEKCLTEKNDKDKTIYFLLMLKFCDIDENFFRITSTLNAEQIITILLFEDQLLCSLNHCITAFNYYLSKIVDNYKVQPLPNSDSTFSPHDCLMLAKTKMQEIDQMLTELCLHHYFGLTTKQ